MQKVIKIFREIQETSSLNQKKTIIAANKDNKLFKRCLVFLLDTNITTGIAESKIKKFAERTCLALSSVQLSSFEDVMEYLKVNNTGRDVDIANVKRFICKHDLSDEESTFYLQMVTKSLKLGCDKKVVNSVIPNLIPSFEVMLGTPIEKCNLKDGEWISISRKLNGCRAAFVGDKIMTRQGKVYSGVNHIIKDLQNLGYSNMFVDGELLYKNKEGLSDSEAFQKGTGIAMSKDLDKSDLKLVVFDMFPLDEFWTGKSKLSYLDRNNKYLMPFKALCKNSENLEVVPMVYEGFDHKEIWKWLDYAEAHDWEGCMLNLDTPYECKRTKNLIKVKKFYDISLRVIGSEEGTGRNKGKLGALVCKYYDNTVKVGSGFSDEERMNLWKNRDGLVGKIIDIRYKEITVDKKTGLKSLQFPTFGGFRDPADKAVADDEQEEFN